MSDRHETKPAAILPPEKLPTAADLRRTIFAADDLASETVTVWGVELTVRELTARERDNFEASIVRERKGGTTINRDNIRARLLVITLRDAAGELLFTAADVKELGGKSSRECDRAYEIAARLCGIRAEDEEELLGEDVETTGGGSAGD